MGVANLFGLCRPLLIKTPLSHIVGTLGIDASLIAHSFMQSHAQEIVLEQNYQPLLLDVWATFQRLQSYGMGTLKLLLVFDGFRVEQKLANEQRAHNRAKAMEPIAQYLKDKKQKKKSAESFDVTKACMSAVSFFNIEVAEMLILLCIDKDIEYMIAPMEAEQQLLALQIQNIIDYLLACDNDYIVLGCDQIIMDRLWRSGIAHIFYRKGARKNVVDKELKRSSECEAKDKTKLTDNQVHFLTAISRYGFDNTLLMAAQLLQSDYRVRTGITVNAFCPWLSWHYVHVEGPLTIQSCYMYKFKTSEVPADVLRAMNITKFLFFCQPVFMWVRRAIDCESASPEDIQRGFVDILGEDIPGSGYSIDMLYTILTAKRKEMLNIPDSTFNEGLFPIHYTLSWRDRISYRLGLFDLRYPPWECRFSTKIGLAPIEWSATSIESDIASFSHMLGPALRQYAIQRGIVIPQRFEAKDLMVQYLATNLHAAGAVLKRMSVPEAPTALLTARMSFEKDLRIICKEIAFTPYDDKALDRVVVSVAVVKSYFGVKSYTRRQTKEQEHRSIVNLEAGYVKLNDDVQRKNRHLMYVRGEVSRSYRHDKMSVMCTLLIDKDKATDAWYLDNVEDGNCLLPLAKGKRITTDEGEGETKILKESPCHNHTNCVHIRAVIERIRELGDPGSADGQCKWSKRPTSRKFNPNQHAITLAREFVEQSKDFACAVNRARWNPLHSAHMKKLNAKWKKRRRSYSYNSEVLS